MDRREENARPSVFLSKKRTKTSRPAGDPPTTFHTQNLICVLSSLIQRRLWNRPARRVGCRIESHHGRKRSVGFVHEPELRTNYATNGIKRDKTLKKKRHTKNVRGKTRTKTNRIGKGNRRPSRRNFSASDSLILAIWREKVAVDSPNEILKDKRENNDVKTRG